MLKFLGNTILSRDKDNSGWLRISISNLITNVLNTKTVLSNLFLSKKIKRCNKYLSDNLLIFKLKNVLMKMFI